MIVVIVAENVEHHSPPQFLRILNRVRSEKSQLLPEAAIALQWRLAFVGANDRQARNKRQPPIVFALGYAVEALDQIDILPDYFFQAHGRNGNADLSCQSHGHVFSAAHREAIISPPEFGD